LLEFGRLVRSFLGRKSIHGFSNDQNCCYLAFLNGSTPARRRRLEALRERSIALIMKMDLNLDVRVAAVDMEASRVPSSFQLVRILQFMLKQRIRQDRIIQEYQPSELSSSHPKIAPDTLFPETDLSYVSMQISEDRKDLDLTKKRLSTSIREYTMAQKLSAMGQLSSYYAHELKNPLHNLLNCFEILEDPGETEESREETMDLMKTELTRVVDLTRKMGSHFKPSDEKPDEVDLNELIESTLAFLERKFREHRVKTLFEKSSDLPMLYLVEDQFKQVFLNLFLNALEAMPDGGHLIVATFYVPPIVRITVTDTGMGIDALDLEKIFEAFYTTKKRKGTGLGLFACYNIIQHHGGSLKVNSTPGKGTCFEIILPT
jgi:signal transduction histidine kinase